MSPYGRINIKGQIQQNIKNHLGPKIVVRELLQNADDSRASKVKFLVKQDCFVAELNSEFSMCDESRISSDEEIDCVSKPRSCNMHQFQEIGRGEKEFDEESIGQFGIGFLALWQLALKIELITKKTKCEISWSEEKGLFHYRFTPALDSPDTPFTKFTFYFDLKGENKLRWKEEIQVFEIFDDHKRIELEKSLSEDIGDFIPFLRHIEEVEVRTTCAEVTWRKQLVEGELTIERKSRADD